MSTEQDPNVEPEPNESSATSGSPDVSDEEEVEAAEEVEDADELESAEEAEQVPDEVGIELIEEEPDPLAELQAQLNATTARLRTVSAAYQEQGKEMQAFKVRLERQQALKAEILKGEVVSQLFEPLENLNRSVDAMERAGVDASALDGIRLVHKQFLEAFGKLGLEAVGVVGERFNTNIHEALTTTPVLDKAQDNTVVEVFDHGYRVGTRTIRAARVIVGQYTEPAGEA